MRKIKTEVTVIGNGGAAVLGAKRLMDQGFRTILVCPTSEFELGDIRVQSPLCLWQAAHRGGAEATLPKLLDTLLERMKEVFPAALEEARIEKCEHWSILSSTPVHRKTTDEIEREFFKLEKRPYASGAIRLVNPEHINTRMLKLGLDLTRVSHLDGGVVRSHALSWDPVRIGFFLWEYIYGKFLASENSKTQESQILLGAKIESRVGRQVVVSTQGEKVAIESDRGVLVFLSGDLLPRIRSLTSGLQDPWIQKARKRRREQHFLDFERHKGPKKNHDDLMIDLGETHYRWSGDTASASWVSDRGPDGFERVLDESLRLATGANLRFVRNQRNFRLDWDWKSPQWKESQFDTYWATAYEGDLFGILELLWKLPLNP